MNLLKKIWFNKEFFWRLIIINKVNYKMSTKKDDKKKGNKNKEKDKER